MGTNSRSTRSESARLAPLDMLRGLLIVLMAIDHASFFVAQQHSGEYWGGGLPSYADALPFLTRLVTHLAAPGFFFLMGAGMALLTCARQQQGWSRWAILRRFWLRGALLIVLKFLLVNRAWELAAGGWGLRVYAGVLFGLGAAMLLGSLLLEVKPGYLFLLAIALAVGTELWTPAPGSWGNSAPVLVRLLLLPGGDQSLWVTYPVLPWLGLVAFGIGFGHWLVKDTRKTLDRALTLGVAFLVLFVVLRALNGFGNIRPGAGNTWIDFLNVVKYPPSITFSLLTMSINLILLWLFAQVGTRVQRYLRPLAVFGQSPLFFYVTHLFLYMALGRLLTPHGTTILQMYPYWLLGLLMLYPLCLAYGRLRQRQPAHSLLRLF